MKKLIKKILEFVAWFIPGSVIGLMSLDMLFGLNLLEESKILTKAENKIVSVAKSVKNKIW